MDIFEGFSEEEIRSLSTQKSTDEKKVNATNNSSPSTGVYKNQHNKNRYHNRLPRKNVARERLLKGNCKLTADSKHDHLPKEARLSIPKIPEEEEYESDEPKDKTKIITKIPVTTTDKNSRHENETNTNIKTNQSTEKNCNKIDENINSETSMQNRNDNDRLIGSGVSLPILNSEGANIDSLEQFQTRQKLMEEQNHRRKEILKRALADRAKKTHAEVKRLNEIEGELKKLDLLLSNDVAIIRNQIENASIDFMEAQKRYDRAEKEFLDAKLELFNKKERKELLTNHLCTIIEQNEMRKAKKLSDLMTQLEIAPKNSIITSQIEIEYKKKEEENAEERKEEQLSTNKNDNQSKQTETDVNDKKEIITSDS